MAIAAAAATTIVCAVPAICGWPTGTCTWSSSVGASTSPGAAARMGERLRLSVEQTEIKTVGHLTISLGVASWPASGQTAAEVIKKADELMYLAKQQGRMS